MLPAVDFLKSLAAVKMFEGLWGPCEDEDNDSEDLDAADLRAVPWRLPF